MSARRNALRVLLVVATVLAAWLTATRLRLSPDLSALFPDRGEAAALARYARAFGGGDLGVVLVRGPDADEVRAAAAEIGEGLRARPSVAHVLDRAPPARELDPTLAWAFAGPRARAKLAEALTPEGMRARLQGTRELLLAPGSADIEDLLAKDPLRLSQIPWEGSAEIAAGVRADADAAFATEDGRARLVVVAPKGSAFESAAAKAFVDDVDAVTAAARARHPSVTFGLAGGHAVARATEAMMKRDLAVSGTLSAVLASLAFVLLFRRARALLAVLPPLALGTLWTTGLAAFIPGGLSAIAIAFAAVVVGVGVDTGVHVYAALLAARRDGLSPSEAAARARKDTWRPTMSAAIIAGLAFASLALSDLAAVGQLGVLCGVGEVLTAVAILLVTPEIGARLERGAPPPERVPRWLAAVDAVTKTPGRAQVALALSVVPVLVLFLVGWPQVGDALVALRPHGLAPLDTQEAIYERFGGRPGQWIVLSIDRDPERARARADDVAEGLELLGPRGSHSIEGYDALSSWLPSATAQRKRLAIRDALDLPSHRADLARALADEGFDLDDCAPALDAFERPEHKVFLGDAVDASSPLAAVLARHVAKDGGDTVVATYVRPTDDARKDQDALARIHIADPQAIVTGYSHLEQALRASLADDLPKVGLVALGIAAVGLAIAFRRARDVALALGTVLLELAALGAAMRLFHVRWHVYDALVVPVLVGITLDESMFLLHAARAAPPGVGATGAAKAKPDAPDAVARALRAQGPLVAATALTTAAGFVALVACRFDGLFDLGVVGTLGVVLGLVAALVVVPAGLRLARPPGKGAR